MSKFAVHPIFALFLFLCVMLATPVSAAYFSKTIVPQEYTNVGTPRDLLRVSDGGIWYVDSQNYRIVKLDVDGNIVRVVGRQGSGDGEFSQQLTSIAADAADNLYVLDVCKVYKLDFNGGYMDSWHLCDNIDGVAMSEPRGIAYTSYEVDGETVEGLLITDTGHGRVLRFDLNGNFLFEFGEVGAALGQFAAPHGITTDEMANIYVADSENHRVQVFDRTGDFLHAFGRHDEDEPDDYEMQFPKDVAILGSGDEMEIAVTSHQTHQIKFFDTDGVFIRTWGQHGSADVDFIHPEYLAADGANLWVSDWSQSRVQRFTKFGDLVSIVSASFNADGYFVHPFATEFDEDGNLYVLDSTGRVQKFDPFGEYLGTIIEAGVLGSSAYHMLIESSSNLLLVSFDSSVAVFDLAGNFISTWVCTSRHKINLLA